MSAAPLLIEDHGHVRVLTLNRPDRSNAISPDLRTALVYRLRIIVQDADAALRQGSPVSVTLVPGR